MSAATDVDGRDAAPLTGGSSPPSPEARTDDDGSATHRWSTRRRRRIAVGAAVALVAGAAGLGVARARAAGGPSSASAPDRPVSTATVSRRDLVERVTVDGTLTYADTRSLGSPRPGTVTWLPAPGTAVERGEPIARIDERPVPVLAGAVPLYRDLAVGVTDGADIRQLEENLGALGHAIDGLVVDDHYDWATRAAVQNWQRSEGREATGAVRSGDLVFTTLPLRIAAVKATVGQPAGPGQPLVEVTAVERIVTVKLDAARQSVANVGDAVEIELPDHRVTGGHIASVSARAETEAAQNGDEGDPKIPVTITLDDATAAGRLDQAPVSVRITERQAAGVLAVPVKALLALREGGYAVEVTRDGTRRYVPVRTGAFAGGLVEVTGELQVGDTVVVAS
jgi:peptidoglycan hydrolase-like protein with peptidoglycan-binding domain